MPASPQHAPPGSTGILLFVQHVIPSWNTLPWGLCQSLPLTHVALLLVLLLPRELSPKSCCSRGRESLQKGLAIRTFAFPWSLPHSKPHRCPVLRLHSQGQSRLKNNRQETCGVPKHFSALPKGWSLGLLLWNNFQSQVSQLRGLPKLGIGL